MNLKQLWSIIRGRQTNFRFLNISWTYYPGGDPMGKKPVENHCGWAGGPVDMCPRAECILSKICHYKGN